MDLRARVRTQLTSALILVGMIGLWILFAPTQFGGGASYVIVAGASMEPNLHTGDLVIARESETYAVGEVVTYSHPQVGPIIHRIIEKTGDRYILQGDNNDWIDSYEPTDAEIRGKSWITLPGAATAIQQLRTPLGLALLSIAVGVMVLATVVRDDHQVENTTGGPVKKASTKPSSSVTELREGWILPLAAILFGGLILGAFAFTRPMIKTIFVEVPYQHQGEFSYYADAPASLYDLGQIQTRDAIFHSVVDEFTVDFTYKLDAPGATKISGDYQLLVELSEPNGWRRQVVLIPNTPFEAGQLSLTAKVDITRLQWLIGHLEGRTNYQRSAYDLRIIPQINLEAIVAGREVIDRFAPALKFKLDDFQLYLDGINPLDESDDPFNPVQINSVERAELIPGTLSILGLEIEVERARWIAGISVAIALAGIAYLAYPIMRTWQQGRAEQIGVQYGEILLEVEKLPIASPVQIIEVSGFSDLAKLAELHRLLILHHVEGRLHTYQLQIDNNFYRFIFQQESVEKQS